MRTQNITAGLLTAVLFVGTLLTPFAASAQRRLDDASHHRQNTKNGWRNAAIGSGVLGVLGLVKHDNTLAIVGAAGTAYSLSRYEHDRKSQSKIDRARANAYSRRSFSQNGHRYTRRMVTKNGQKYYQYVRTR